MINKLNNCGIGDEVYTCYDIDGLTVQEILCQFFTRINECIGDVNKYSELVEGLLNWIETKGLKDEVTNILNRWKEDDTIKNMIEDQIFESLNEKIKDLGYTIDFEEGLTDVDKLKSAMSKGKMNIIIPRDITIDTLIISTRYQKLDFKGDITITGGGIEVNAPNIVIKARKIIGDVIELSGQALKPLPYKKCAINVKSAFANITFEEITGFDTGLLFENGNNGTENVFTGTIQKCKTAVKMSNASGAAKHEGNTFDVKIFQCYKGYDIEVNCKYQNIRKVIDNAQIAGSTDIEERSGHHVITPYFVRLSNSKLLNNNIIFNINGGVYVEVGSPDFGTRVGAGNLELTTTTPFIDAKKTKDKDYEYRLQFGNDSLDFKIESVALPPLKIGKDGFVSLPNFTNVSLPPNFTGVDSKLPAKTEQNKIVFAKNNNDGNKTRLYVYSSGWKFIEMPERVISSGNAAPTTGTWNVGDKVFNNNPTLQKNISHWTCISGGTPGSWTAHGTGAGNTSSKPSLTQNDKGFIYFDNQTRKFCFWDGSSWQQEA